METSIKAEIPSAAQDNPDKLKKCIARAESLEAKGLAEGRIEELTALSLVQAPINVDWDDFERYLKAEHRGNTIKMRMLYAKKYHHIITTPEGPQKVRELQSLSAAKRKEAMCALANLAKFLGLYNGWRQLKQEHDLRWTRFSPEAQAAVFEEMFYRQDKGFSAMLDWFKDMRKRLSAEYAAYVDFLVLSGLRPDEGCHAINILLRDPENYLNKDRMMLEHFRYPGIFIRRTKKAYVSAVTDRLLNAVKVIEEGEDEIPDSYYDFYHRLYGRMMKNSSDGGPKVYGKKLPMNNCRKIYGTWLRMNGIESEFINLLQGRVAQQGSKSPEEVFARHYFRPDFDATCQKVRILTEQLYVKTH